ncbi:MAG TPA: tRNA 2-selenouridine(34) synthase MnmH [Burkholderiaceae bacterium]|nr:tRNA 2-selenouridine(34) synthase MnmH [Burkholderiaceae bacterium]
MKRDHAAIEAADALAHLDSYDTIVDVRSEGEFAEDHVPGAINCPVLSDDERREVGTMDRQQSSFEARRRGAALVARNIARHLEQRFADRPRDWHPLVYCWRGGNRSGSMVHILSRVGWRAEQLHGGYRAYRRAVMAALDTLPAQLTFKVICGATGSGKSRLLQHLVAAGAQVLDLEALARHRGSVLGGLPSQPQPGQKLFESLIWDALRRCRPDRPVFVESESRKVGNLHVPDQLLLRMRESECVALDVPLPARIRLLREEYGHFERDPQSLLVQLDGLVELHGREKVAQWKALAAARHWDRVVEQLLTEHYDPAYRRSIARNFKRVGDAPSLYIGSVDSAAYTAAARSLGA